MTEEEAERLVYAFADVLAEHSEHILDAKLLPASKAEIYGAFAVLISYYEDLARTDPVSFEARGNGKTLQEARALRWRVADFQAIDPEDEAAVAAVNARGPEIRAKLSDDTLSAHEMAEAVESAKKALSLILKYHRRGMAEDEGRVRP